MQTLLTSAEERELPFMVAEYVVPEYSRREIEAAGKALAERITDVEEAVGFFRIAYNWRDAHLYPMRRLRFDLLSMTRKAKTTATIAARIKRMKSIRKKLKESSLTLYRIQDIGGCRAIVGTISEQRRIISRYENGRSKYGIVRHSPYVDSPRSSGYRSHHIVQQFSDTGDTAIYNDQRVEVQIRTRLQHAWATAVEATGLIQHEDLKGGHGDPHWLRLFAIMSAEMAILEDSPCPPNVSENYNERRDELRELDNQLSAVTNLRRWNSTIKFTDVITDSVTKLYLMQYDPNTQRVTVKPVSRISQGLESALQAEQNKKDGEAVLVELDKAADLKAAYPNYFLDVQIFADLLAGVTANRSRQELEAMISPIVTKPTSTPIGLWNFGRWKAWGRARGI